MINIDNDIVELENIVGFIRGIFDPAKVTSKIKNLKNIAEKDNFWENPNLASKTLSEKSKLENILKNFNSLEKDLLDLTELTKPLKMKKIQRFKKKFMTL